MEDSGDSLTWSTDIFLQNYNCIRYQEYLSPALLNAIRKDLFIVLNVPPKNSSSRDQLLDLDKPTTFSNGELFNLNREFVEASLQLSLELDLDEIQTAELLYYSLPLCFERGTSFVDSGRLAFFNRSQCILNILGHLISTKSLHLVLKNKYDEFFNNILLSFERIYSMLSKLNGIIDKQKYTGGINDATFVASINFIKKQLFDCHELLAKVYFSLIDFYFENYGKLVYYYKVIDLMKKNLNDDDILVIHYLPGLLKFITCVNLLKEEEVCNFHSQIKTQLTTEYQAVSSKDGVDLSRLKIRGFEVFLSFVMLTSFISWCKVEPSRSQRFDFYSDILKYCEICVSCGVTEILMCYAAETSKTEAREDFEKGVYYDFRSLLKDYFSDMQPRKFTYPNQNDIQNPNTTEDENVSKLFDTSAYHISDDFNDNLIAPLLHLFFVGFICNAAVILMQLRDSEEDFLLSSINRRQLKDKELDLNFDSNTNEGTPTTRKNQNNGNDQYIDLQELAPRADLERFYMAFVYNYSSRPEICSLFWSHDESSSEIGGFISWGLSNNTSPLITATFCLLLGSLASAGNSGAAKIWDILLSNNVLPDSKDLRKTDFSKISINSIIESLNYYFDALSSNLEQNIVEALQTHHRKQELLFSSTFINSEENPDGNDKLNASLIELSEDSIVFISGFIYLVSSIVKNLAHEEGRSPYIKGMAFNNFMPVVKSFFKFDNFVTLNRSVQSSTSYVNGETNSSKVSDLPNVFINEENRVIIVNALLNLLRDFIVGDETLERRHQVWDVIDRWLFQSMKETEINNTPGGGSSALSHVLKLLSGMTGVQSQLKLKALNRWDGTISQMFQYSVNSFSLVQSFTRLILTLLTPLPSDSQKAFSPYKLLYPADLGSNYRYNGQVGVWPYIEFLLLEVFAKSKNLPEGRNQVDLQLLLVSIVETSLNEVDWVFINDLAPHMLKNISNFDAMVDCSLEPLSYQLFVKLHHSLAVLHYFFDENVYAALFRILNTNVDSLATSEAISILVKKALNVTLKILEQQDTFLLRLLPILKNEESQIQIGKNRNTPNDMSLAVARVETVGRRIYYPKTVGPIGVSNFYEILLFNLPTVANLAHLVGSTDVDIANLSILLLQCMSQSTFFVSDVNGALNPLMSRNRLLTIFEKTEDSIDIQFAFILQLERTVDSQKDLETKVNLLRFLLDNLNDQNKPSVSQYLLGYQIRGNNLLLSESTHSNSLLRSLLLVLDSCLHGLSITDYENGNLLIIDAAPAILASMILEILVKLCRNPLTSMVTLAYLRNQTVGSKDFFAKLVEYQPKIDPCTVWCSSRFEGNLILGSENEFLLNKFASAALISFIKHRNLVLQYLSLEFHTISLHGSIVKKNRYANLLLNSNEFISGVPKILNFLDVLNFKFYNLENYADLLTSENFNIGPIMDFVAKGNESGYRFLDLSILEKLFKLTCKKAAPQLHNKESRIAFSENLVRNGARISEFLIKYSISSELKTCQLYCLQSWTQLVQVLVSDSDMSAASKSNLILEILRIILPRIDDYLGQDISFSKELISLCVLLVDLYEETSRTVGNDKEKILNFIERVMPLFKSCVGGILRSESTPELRSDLYVLMNMFLQKSLGEENLSKRFLGIIKLVEPKLIHIISGDSVYTEGAPRITSLVLLESLVNLFSEGRSNYILEIMIKSNTLSMLIKSIKRTDEIIFMFLNSGSNTPKTDLATLIYELTALKTTLYFLIRVAQTRVGASHLSQNEVFNVLKESRFLSIDPDLGVKLRFNDLSDKDAAVLMFSLDVPLTLLNSTDFDGDTSRNEISLFEFFIPIFQLVAAILLSMGPSHKPSRLQTKDFLSHFYRLILGVMKRDYLVESNQLSQTQHLDRNDRLRQLSDLVVLLYSLVDYETLES